MHLHHSLLAYSLTYLLPLSLFLTVLSLPRDWADAPTSSSTGATDPSSSGKPAVRSYQTSTTSYVHIIRGHTHSLSLTHSLHYSPSIHLLNHPSSHTFNNAHIHLTTHLPHIHLINRPCYLLALFRASGTSGTAPETWEPS